jgi:hypothetical protein
MMIIVVASCNKVERLRLHHHHGAWVRIVDRCRFWNPVLEMAGGRRSRGTLADIFIENGRIGQVVSDTRVAWLLCVADAD